MEVLELLDDCIASLLRGQLPPTPLLAALLSKALGYIVILGACVTKIPQIRNVVRAKSARGLSELSCELETVGLFIHSAYGIINGLPFNAFGEASILLVQSVILVRLVLHYNNASRFKVTIATLALAGAATAVLQGLVTPKMIKAAFDFNSLLFLCARVPQILKNFRARSTGELSLITCSMNLGGCLARIFTSLQQGAGGAMVRSFILALTLNTIMVGQILMYRPKRASAQAKDKKTK